MEYMYNVYNFDTASYEPFHEKICLRGVRRRHKMVCMATEASWRLEFGILIGENLCDFDCAFAQ